MANQPTSAVYHIHEEPVVDGNCTSTLAHLDPYHRGETPACDASKPESCQVGDLSGKYGKITSDPFLAEYFDLYTSLKPGSPAFFGNRSIVVHYANKTRLTCANFAKLQASSGHATKLAHTASGSHTASSGPIATGTHHNITGPHNTASHQKPISPQKTAGLHNATHIHSSSGVLTATGIVTAPGSPTTTTLESLTTTAAAGGTSPTSSIVPFPGAAAGNSVSMSILSGVVALLLFLSL